MVVISFLTCDPMLLLWILVFEIHLTAIFSPVVRSSPMFTVPKAPDPIYFPIS